MDATTRLAAQAADLAVNINTLSENCVHDEIGNDINTIAAELSLLSTTLCRLHEAMQADTQSYTDAFRQDLDEIMTELRLVIEEVSECCSQLQKSDSPSLTSTAWFFRKGRASRLQKHLEALKTTIIVMRTVLHHGKDYGIQTSPGRLAESTPHTMSEDRAILGAVFAKNRSAIVDSAATRRKSIHSHSASTSSETAPELDPGAHGRNLSFATGVEGIEVPDVLPPKPKADEKKEDPPSLSRRFSKRVGLGVHKSILEINAEETEATLRKRWIKASHQNEVMPSIVEITPLGDEKSKSTSVTTEIPGPASVAPNQNQYMYHNSLAQLGTSIGKALNRTFQRLSVRSKADNKENVKGDNGNVATVTVHSSKDTQASPKSPISVLKSRLTGPYLKKSELNQHIGNVD